MTRLEAYGWRIREEEGFYYIEKIVRIFSMFNIWVQVSDRDISTYTITNMKNKYKSLALAKIAAQTLIRVEEMKREIRESKPIYHYL